MRSYFEILTVASVFLVTPLPNILGPLDMQHSLSQERDHKDDRQRNHILISEFQ